MLDEIWLMWSTSTSEEDAKAQGFSAAKHRDQEQIKSRVGVKVPAFSHITQPLFFLFRLILRRKPVLSRQNLRWTTPLAELNTGEIPIAVHIQMKASVYCLVRYLMSYLLRCLTKGRGIVGCSSCFGGETRVQGVPSPSNG